MSARSHSLALALPEVTPCWTSRKTLSEIYLPALAVVSALCTSCSAAITAGRSRQNRRFPPDPYGEVSNG